MGVWHFGHIVWLPQASPFPPRNVTHPARGVTMSVKEEHLKPVLSSGVHSAGDGNVPNRWRDRGLSLGPWVEGAVCKEPLEGRGGSAGLSCEAWAGFHSARLGCQCGVPSVNGGALTKALEARRRGGAHR